MLQLILKSHLAFLLIPLLTLAMEPNNPVTFCDRFLGDADKASCVQKTEQGRADWYAASACSLQEDDKQFLICLDEIKNATYSPEAIELCANSREISDAERLGCLQKIKNRDYTRAEIKTCAEGKTVAAITACLSPLQSGRKPASRMTPKAAPSTRAGFQSL